MTTDPTLPEWISFDEAMPRTGKKLLIKLKDGRELKGERIHTELVFDDIRSGKLKASRWDLQMMSTHWKYR